MGKTGPRLSSRKKAKRWAKGQSSSSNPETKKYREQATSMFFKDFGGTKGITVGDIKKHDAMQGLQPSLASLKIDEDVQSTEASTVNTSDTFATDYSNCTNITFDRFLQHFQSCSLLHKEMLAVLSAVTEVIKQNNGTESSTEYFAALISTLEVVEDDTSVAAVLSLLAMSVRTVDKAVLNIKFGEVSPIFLEVLKRYTESENFLIIHHCIRCLCLMLRAQEPSVWQNSSTTQTLDVILSFCVHSKPKVRKAAQHGICMILKGYEKKENKPLAHHPGASQVAKHCIAQLFDMSDSDSVTTILHTLNLLKDVFHHLPKSDVKTICEGLLRLMELKNVLVTSCCLQTFHNLFVSRPSESTLPAQRNVQIIKALYDYQPSKNDTQPILAWLVVLQEAHCNLAQIDLVLCSTILPRFLKICIDLWLSDKMEVISGVSNTIKTILLDCIALMCKNDSTKFNSVIEQVTDLLMKALNYQYLESWKHILHLVAVLFQVSGETKNGQLLILLKRLFNLQNREDFVHKSEIEYAIGAAIRSMGPEIVIKTLPLRNPDGSINLQRTWLVTLLKECVVHGSIAFFMEELMPLITICEERAKLAGGKEYELLLPKLWAIFPSLCSNASDVKNNFEKIARTLGTCIGQRTDLRLPVMAGLRKLIVKAVEKDDSDDISTLARFAKNYLPILLNLYQIKGTGTDMEGQRLAAFETIKVYLTITKEDLVNELIETAFTKLKNAEDDSSKEAIYDLIRVLCEYTDITRLKRFYYTCVTYLKDPKKPKDQKKAYRFIEDISASQKGVCQDFLRENQDEIRNLLISVANSVSKISRGCRLRCFINIIKGISEFEDIQFLESLIPEAVLCIKDLNERCRNSAYNLLNIITDKFLENPELLGEYIKILLVGLDGEPKYRSATLLALASITYNYNGSLGVDTVQNILQSVCKHTSSPTREVADAAMSYVKVYVSVMPIIIVAPRLTDIINAITEMQEDCQRHCRQKIRDLLTKLVRKFGFSTVASLVPSTDVVLQKRLKNIHKIEEQKRKLREQLKQQKEENDDEFEFNAKKKPKTLDDLISDSDGELDDMDEKESKKKKKRTSRKDAWIQENEENIVDLNDPSATRNITTTQPGVSKPFASSSKKEKHGFKTTPEGKLIIMDDDDSDSEVKKKSKMLNLDSDDEDIDADDGGKSVASFNEKGRKRRLSDSADVLSVKSLSTVKSRYEAGGVGIHRPLKQRKTEQVLGAEYRSAKAKGDMKKKGKPDPYAYVPLTRSVLNKRKKRMAQKGNKLKNLFKKKK